VAGQTEPVVVNAHTGLAISGFDPVAFFADKAPRFGRPDLELALGGNIWRFSNVGNRAAFAEHPEVYLAAMTRLRSGGIGRYPEIRCSGP